MFTKNPRIFPLEATQLSTVDYNKYQSFPLQNVQILILTIFVVVSFTTALLGPHYMVFQFPCSSNKWLQIYMLGTAMWRQGQPLGTSMQPIYLVESFMKEYTCVCVYFQTSVFYACQVLQLLPQVSVGKILFQRGGKMLVNTQEATTSLAVAIILIYRCLDG